MKTIALAVLLLCSGMASAQGTSATVAREIDQLFVALEQSGCQFFRNGSWYGPKQAGSHLRRKHEYLAKKGLITTAESFIDLAASKSSTSGKPYTVKCPGTSIIESKSWFTARLEVLRSGTDARN